MDAVSQISEFGKILIFLITGIITVCFAFFINRLIAPNHPNTEKLTSYECGEEPTGNAWLPFNSRFYVIALIFLLFDVEMVFVFPWAIVFGDREIIELDPRWGWFALTEMFIFLGILILGLAYVWCKGDLDWIKPDIVLPTTDTNIPSSLYNKVNREQTAFKVKTFEPELIEATTIAAPVAAAAPPVRKPMLKSAFKKTENEQ